MSLWLRQAVYRCAHWHMDTLWLDRKYERDNQLPQTETEFSVIVFPSLELGIVVLKYYCGSILASLAIF